MRAGLLRKTVVVQSTNESRTSSGAVANTWATHCTRRAAVEPISGKEYFDARAENANVTVKFRLRHDSLTGLITPKMRVSYDSRYFDIESVINTGERDKEIILMCRELV